MGQQDEAPREIQLSGTSGKAEVHVDIGSLGMEFFLSKDPPRFHPGSY